MRILLGGSPCTNWSIANGRRETEPEGIGWELFKNYIIAKDKFKPDFFLYENNKSAAETIKEQIAECLGYPLQYINSALVSAQTRQRFYVHNIPNVLQPEDRNILFSDILEDWQHTGAEVKFLTDKGLDYMCRNPVRLTYGYIQHRTLSKAKCITSNIHKGVPYNVLVEGHCDLIEGIPVQEVCNGIIRLPNNQYNVKLPDGFYTFRGLSVAECRRLQTVPDWVVMPCAVSPNYKMLGNSWTVEVIKHILGAIPNITSEPIEVLSMYDGMSAGQIALKELGCTVKKYVSYEIDKPCITTTNVNFPSTEQRGDAFQLRNTAWVY